MMKNAFFRIPKEWGILFFWLSSFSWAESNVCTGLFSKIRNNIGAATRLTEDVKLGDSFYKPIFDEADWADVVQDSSLYGQLFKRANIKISTALRSATTGNKNPAMFKLSSLSEVKDRLNVLTTTTLLKAPRKVFGMPNTPTRFSPHWLMAIPVGWGVSQFVPAEVVAVSDPVGTTISESLNQATHWLNSEADRVESEQAAEIEDSKNRRDQIWGLMLLRSDYRYQGFAENYEASVSDRSVILNQILADYHTMKKGLAEYYQSKNFKSDLEDGSLLEYLEGKRAVPKSKPSDATLMALAEHLAPLTMFVEQIKNGDIPEYIVFGDASKTNPKDFRVSDENFKRLIKSQVEVFMAQEKTWINFSNLIVAQAGLFENSAEEAKKVFEDLEKHSLYDNAFSKRIVDDLKKELITPSQASILIGEYFQNLGMLKTDEIMGWTRIDPVNQAKVELKDLEKHMQDKLEDLEKANLSRKPASLKESGTKKGKK